jgi:branched-subunit amino acid ABC-type transport system permease component
VYLLFDSLGTVIVYASTAALVSMAFALTYHASGFPNLYTGSYMIFGIYSAYTLTQLLKITPYYGLVPGFIFGGLFASVFYWLVIRTMQKRGSDDVRLTLATLSLVLIPGAVANIILYWFIAFEGIYISVVQLNYADFLFFNQPGVVVVSPLIAVLVAVSFWRVGSVTRLSYALRGSAENAELAMVCGVNPYLIQAMAWFVAGGLSGVAGALFPIGLSGSLYTGLSSMFTLIMAAAILGGLESPSWALLGAFIIVPVQAIIEYSLSMTYGEFVGDYHWIIPPLILWFTLLLEPGGLRSVYMRVKSRES